MFSRRAVDKSASAIHHIATLEACTAWRWGVMPYSSVRTGYISRFKYKKHNQYIIRCKVPCKRGMRIHLFQLYASRKRYIVRHAITISI